MYMQSWHRVLSAVPYTKSELEKREVVWLLGRDVVLCCKAAPRNRPLNGSNRTQTFDLKSQSAMSAVFGVLCRLLWYSSLAYDCQTNVTLELSTPRNTAPDGILVCFMDPSAVQMKGQVAVQSLQQGGDLWQQAGGRELITPAADSSEAASSSPFSIDESDSVTELASDPYYSSGYASEWCACLVLEPAATACR